MDNQNNNVIEQLHYKGWRFSQYLYEKCGNTYRSIEDIIKKHGWKLQNYIYTNNSTQFIFYLSRLYSVSNCQLDKELICLLKTDSEKQFKRYALAYISGLLSGKNIKRENGGIENEYSEE